MACRNRSRTLLAPMPTNICAELANMVNEAALRAVRQGRKFVTQADLQESIEVVIAGYQKKNKILTDHERLVPRAPGGQTARGAAARGPGSRAG